MNIKKKILLCFGALQNMIGIFQGHGTDPHGWIMLWCDNDGMKAFYNPLRRQSFPPTQTPHEPCVAYIFDNVFQVFAHQLTFVTTLNMIYSV